MLHRAADEALAGLAPGVTMVSRTRPEMQGYVDLARDFEPKDAPYLQNHRGHLMFVKPEEKRFVSAELISATSFRMRAQSASACSWPGTSWMVNCV